LKVDSVFAEVSHADCSKGGV